METPGVCIPIMPPKANLARRERSLYIGLTEFMWAAAGGVGPILGGTFTELLSWRWAFWINLPISGLTFLLLLLFLDVHNPRTPVLDGVKAIDWLGSASILGLVLMLLLGLDFGGAIFPWNSPKVICLIVFGALMSLFFIYSEKRIARYPLIPFSVIGRRSCVVALLVCFFHGFVRLCGLRFSCLGLITVADIYRFGILHASLSSIVKRPLSSSLRSCHITCHT